MIIHVRKIDRVRDIKRERTTERELKREREREVDIKNTKIKMRWMKIKISNLGICFQTGKINKNIIVLNNI